MSTVQIIGVSVAGAAVLLLIIALFVTRTREGAEEQDEVQSSSSFLDERPQDTFSSLGKPEQPVEDITLDPAVERAAEAERAAAARAVQEQRQPQPGGLGLDWGPDLSVRELEHESITPPWPGDDEITGDFRPGDESEITSEIRPGEEWEVTGEIRRADQPETAGELHPSRDGAPPRTEPEGLAAEREPAAAEAAREAVAESHLVPLSDIIVTTSSKLVDLQDPDVRRMLTDLVTFEIDQAADFRRRGQTIDAVLQLTEAEKVSRALGMAESARRIHAMMQELRQAE